MIPGIMAGQVRPVAGTARPVYVSSQSTASASASFTAVLPTGWVAGQLAIMQVASGTSAPSTPPGWTAFGSTLSADAGTSALFWRILQSGDSGPTISTGTNRIAIIWTFEVGTFNPATPVVQIATYSSGAGLTSTFGVPNSSSVTVGDHYVMQFSSSYNAFNTITTYPYASAQQNRGIGSAPEFVAGRGCGANFNGGVSAASDYVISTGAYVTSHKIAIIGLGFVP